VSDALKDAIAEAVDDKGEAWLSEPDPSAPPAAPEPAEVQPSKGETPDPPAPAEPVIDGEAAEPETFWGVPLEGVPDDKKREILALGEQQEGYIHQLQEKLAEAKAAAAETPAPPEPAPSLDDVSDDDLLKAAGYDPEDPEVQMMTRFIVPSLRRELALEDQLSAMAQRDAVQEAEVAWNRQMDALEKKHGALGVERVEQLQYAMKHGINSPGDLYLELSAPTRQVESLVYQARIDAAKAAAGGQLKPSSSNAGEPPVKPDMSLREAVQAAAKAAEKETGRKWTSILRKGTPGDE
jgi:hypothetical protein